MTTHPHQTGQKIQIITRTGRQDAWIDSIHRHSESIELVVHTLDAEGSAHTRNLFVSWPEIREAGASAAGGAR